MLFPDFQSLDLTGPLEVLYCATRIARETGRGAGYAPVLFADQAGAVASASGLSVAADRSFRGERGALDTLLVVGGPGVERAAHDARLVGFVQRMAGRSHRVAAVCTGAFVLGAAGLLAGQRATTHWAYAERLAQHVPDARVEADAIFIQDGRVYTSAGVTAGMDLTLSLVETDLGHDIALAVARHLVLYVHRAGGQSQFSAPLRGQVAEYEPIREVQRYVLEHCAADMSVAALARRAHMSARNFARVFGREVGLTPGAYVERVRVEVARRLLEQTSLGMEQVAARCGFGGPETLRRAFSRQLAITPTQYRARFHARTPQRQVQGRSS